jgi:hypothetical protein
MRVLLSWLSIKKLETTETFRPPAILHSTRIDGTLRPDSICASIARLTPLADQLRHHVNHRRAINHHVTINLAVKTLLIPVGDSAEEIIMMPAAVAEHTVLQTLVQRVEDAGRSGKIHVGNGKWQ